MFKLIRLTKTGFTLLNIVVALAVTVILVVMAVVGFGGYETIRLNSAVRKLASDIRYSQSLAMNTNQRYGFWNEPTRYHIYHLSRDNIIINPIKRTSLAVCYDRTACPSASPPYTEENFYPEFDGITISKCCGVGVYEFDGLGRPFTYTDSTDPPWEVPVPLAEVISGCSDYGWIKLTSPRSLITKKIRIEAETGNISIE